MTRSIVLIGLKHSGKSTMADGIADVFDFDFIDLDRLIEKEYRSDSAVSCREIYRNLGREGFMELETEAAHTLALRLDAGGTVAALGGGTVDNRQAMEVLRPRGTVVFIREREDVLFERILKTGIPAFLPQDSPEAARKAFHEIFERRDTACLEYADIVLDLRETAGSGEDRHGEDPEAALERLTSLLAEHGYAR